jgi:ribose 5-phosphate isomerase
MTTAAEILQKLVGRHFRATLHPAGVVFNETKRKGEFVVTDVGEQFIEVKYDSLWNKSKHYYNIHTIVEIIMAE